MRVKRWRALEGPPKEVFFPQEHRPGALCESDFTHMTSLGVTIRGQRFEHLIYHFVLTYSNWETGSICFSESFESLSEGLQRALWELGGVPRAHRTDRLSAAVHKDLSPDVFTDRYSALLRQRCCGTTASRGRRRRPRARTRTGTLSSDTTASSGPSTSRSCSAVVATSRAGPATRRSCASSSRSSMPGGAIGSRRSSRCSAACRPGGSTPRSACA